MSIHQRIHRGRKPLHRHLFGERLEDRAMLAVLFEHGVSDPVRAIVPTQGEYDEFGLDWLGGSEPFYDTTWMATSGASNAVGYDRGSGAYDSLLGLDVESAMYGTSPTVFVRAEFNVTDPLAVNVLTLQLRYDDGFVAWLNGTEVARANASGVYPAWSATATATHQASTTTFDVFDLTNLASALHVGTNVLAIRGLNANVVDDDALIQFTLTGESRTGPPLARDDAASTSENEPVTIDVLANDDNGIAPISPSTVAVAMPPAHGTALTNADGTITYTPAATFNGLDTFSYTVRDNSTIGAPFTQTLVASNAAVKAMVPPNDDLGTTWRGGNEPFNDSSWIAGTYGVGYDTNPANIDFNPLIGLNVGAALQNVNTTLYIRSTFSIANPADVTALTLRMRFDDGFAAFVNGVQVASAYAPASLSFNSTTSDGSNGDDNAIVFQTFNVSSFISALRPGTNVLAIHGLNLTAGSSDLLMQPELTATVHEQGRLSNAATVSVDVAGVEFAPIARDDAYSIIAGQSVEATNLPAGAVLWPAQDGGNGHAYMKVSVPATIDWTNARAAAESLGGHLVTITSQAESNFINANFPGNDGGWIGGYQERVASDFVEPAGGWRWITGEAWEYTNWVPGEPNESGGILEDFLVTNNSRWNDHPNWLGYIHDYYVEFPASANVLANDTDADGDSLTAILVTPPSRGSLALAIDGTFIYTPFAGFVGVDTFTYRASDGVILSDPATVSITVNRALPLADGLTGYWSFDGHGADLSGNARDLQLYGGVGFASGLFGQALDMHRNSSQFAARPVSDAVFNFGAATHSTLVDLNATWAYETSGTDLGTAWRESGFNDNAWARHTGPFSTVGAPASSALSFSGAGATLDGPFAGYTLGWEFNVTTPITVASVGWFDSGAGLSVSHPVGIYTNTGALLASATVVAGDPLVSSVSPQPGAGFRYHALASPLTLGIGTYRIGGLNPAGSTDKDYDFVQSVTTIPQVSFVHSYYRSSGVLGFPNAFGDREKGYFGVNFQLAGGAPALNLGPSTYYFRTRFAHTPADGALELTLESLVDDGAIFYLNGVEVYRQNMPAGVVGYSTLATTTVGTASLGWSLTIPAASLAPGDNVLAVEVHQASLADIDAAFNARLRSIVTPPSAELPPLVVDGGAGLSDMTQTDFTIQEWVNFDTTSDEQVLIEKLDGDGDLGWTFTKLDNNALRFTGFNVADTPALTIPTNHWHQFLVRKNGLQFDIYFNGVLIRSTAADEDFSGASRPLLIGKRNDGDGRNFAVDGRIDEVAIWNRALSDAEIAALYNGGSGTTLNNCASCADAYSVNEDGTLMVDVATGVLINDTAQSDESLAASVVALPGHGTLTLVADGSFAYTPSRDFFGADSFTYRVTSNLRGPRIAAVSITINAVPDAPIGVDDTYSTGVGQVLSINAAPGPVSTSFIPANSSWKYRDTITNGSAYPVDPQGDRWTENDYDEAAWPSGTAILGYGVIDFGPLSAVIGYGGNASDKYRTTLFRRTFDIANADRVMSLAFDALIDDGAVIYINGREVLRHNLPGTLGDSAINTNTLALQFGNEAGYASFTVDAASFPGLLVDGTNGIAIEVHQVDPTSTDLGFDLSLTATSLPDPTTVGVLANDSDADGNDLAAMLVTGPSHGTLQLSANGAFTYTPVNAFTGVDQFKYRATDGQLFSEPTTVRIVVQSPTTLPEDLNADGAINAGDVAFLLANYGTASGAKAIEGDLDGDARIEIRDAIALRNAFTPAPSPSAAAALIARAHDRAIEPIAGDSNGLRASRRVLRPGDDLSEAMPAAVDQALVASAEEPNPPTGRCSRLWGRYRE
ncbi:MAG: Ig-like domain-containing protein [Pirellulales bacterium]